MATPPPMPEKSSDEKWNARREFLLQSGYALRPELDPEWKSKEDNSELLVKVGSSYFLRPSEVNHMTSRIMDATRIDDGKIVFLKEVSKRLHPFEIGITKAFSQPPHVHHPRNRCVQLLDVLYVPNNPDIVIMVMPQLRDHYDPDFDTIGEFVDFFRQICEGLQHMHRNFVAHRDVKFDNIMMDPTKLYPDGYHLGSPGRAKDGFHRAKHLKRTQCWPQYFLTDFGLSTAYDPRDGPPQQDIILGGDRSPPEYSKDSNIYSCNPFPTDIYSLGGFLDLMYDEPEVRNLEWLQQLLDEMRHPEPSKRPTIEDVVVKFDTLWKGLSKEFLRSPGPAVQDRTPLYPVSHLWRKWKWILLGKAPLPERLPIPSPMANYEKLRAFYMTDTSSPHKAPYRPMVMNGKQL